MSDSPSTHDDLVRESFGRQVSLFTGDDSPFAVRAASPTAWLDPLTPDLVVLDVACGAAHVAESVAASVRAVVGIDLTPELLDLGATRLRAAGIDNVVLQVGSAESMPFVAESFDLVCSRASLHHMGDPERAFAEMVRVRRSGGRVVVSDLVIGAPERDRYDGLHRLLDPSHQRVFTPDELLAVVPAGISVTRTATTSGRYPLVMMLNEQSDAATVEAALRDEIAGGPATGFVPQIEDDALTVAFTNCTVEVTRPGAGGPLVPGPADM